MELAIHFPQSGHITSYPYSYPFISLGRVYHNCVFRLCVHTRATTTARLVRHLTPQSACAVILFSSSSHSFCLLPTIICQGESLRYQRVWWICEITVNCIIVIAYLMRHISSYSTLTVVSNDPYTCVFLICTRQICNVSVADAIVNASSRSTRAFLTQEHASVSYTKWLLRYHQWMYLAAAAAAAKK